MEFASGCGRKRAPIILSTRRTLVRARRLFLSFFFQFHPPLRQKNGFHLAHVRLIGERHDANGVE